MFCTTRASKTLDRPVLLMSDGKDYFHWSQRLTTSAFQRLLHINFAMCRAAGQWSSAEVEDAILDYMSGTDLNLQHKQLVVSAIEQFVDQQYADPAVWWRSWRWNSHPHGYPQLVRKSVRVWHTALNCLSLMIYFCSVMLFLLNHHKP